MFSLFSRPLFAQSIHSFIYLSIFLVCHTSLISHRKQADNLSSPQTLSQYSLNAPFFFHFSSSSICSLPPFFLEALARNFPFVSFSTPLFFVFPNTIFPKSVWLLSSALFLYKWAHMCIHTHWYRSTGLHCPAAIHHHFISLNWMPSGPLILRISTLTNSCSLYTEAKHTDTHPIPN